MSYTEFDDEKEVSRRVENGKLVIDSVATHTYESNGKSEDRIIKTTYVVDPKTSLLISGKCDRYDKATNELVDEYSYTFEYNKQMEADKTAYNTMFNTENGVCEIKVYEDGQERVYKVGKGTRVRFYDRLKEYEAYSDKECTQKLEGHLDTTLDSVTMYIKAK